MAFSPNASAYISDLLFENKILRDQVEAYRSGDKISRIKEDYRRLISEKDREISRLKKELAEARRDNRRNLDNWMKAGSDIESERDAALERAEKAEAHANELRESLFNVTNELCETKKELQKEQEKNKDLRMKLEKDYSNSSKPSSQSPDHPTIKNGRVRSGKKPGGQYGHIHHERPKREANETVMIPQPEEFLDPERYRPTEKYISKQYVGIAILPIVTEYTVRVFIDLKTGNKVHAPFPGGLKDDVTYDGTVKAFAYLLNNELNVSIGKVHDFMSEITDGELTLSTGMISKLAKEFSEKSQTERDEIFKKLLVSPYMNVDFTFGRMNGKQTTVLVCVSGDNILYQGKEKKGYEGIKDSPIPLYNGTIVSDHEKTFLEQGSKHQECLSHVDRYSLGAEELEPEKVWATEMQKWISDAIHSRNVALAEGSEKISNADELKKKFRDILAKADAEFKKNPPKEGLRDAYNLFKRMQDTPGDYLLFLDDLTVPPTNNDAERAGRKFKRKAHQVMAFRSQDGVVYYCDGLTVIESLRAQGKNVYDEVALIFNNSMPKQKMKKESA